ncbi:MAG: hypothetical protein ACI4KF_06650 [Huintestinicola sp.]
MHEYRNSNLAYKEEISKFEDYAQRAENRPAPDIKIRSASKEAVAAPSLILGVIVMGILMTSTINAKADIAAIHTEIVNQEAKVHALENENAGMKARLETKSSQKAVEEYAENVLGMQKLDKSQIEYVSLESGNVIEISETETGLPAAIKNAFNKFVEYLKG